MIKKAIKIEDASMLAKMASYIWHDTIEELEKVFIEIIQNKDAYCGIYYIDQNPVGFVQCGLRVDYVEGTSSSPVAYLEGIYVDENDRNQGIAKALVEECKKWGKEKGCKEIASDCELTNTTSAAFHEAIGFQEANRIICFTCPLDNNE